MLLYKLNLFKNGLIWLLIDTEMRKNNPKNMLILSLICMFPFLKEVAGRVFETAGLAVFKIGKVLYVGFFVVHNMQPIIWFLILACFILNVFYCDSLMYSTGSSQAAWSKSKYWALTIKKTDILSLILGFSQPRTTTRKSRPSVTAVLPSLVGATEKDVEIRWRNIYTRTEMKNLLRFTWLSDKWLGHIASFA